MNRKERKAQKEQQANAAGSTAGTAPVVEDNAQTETSEAATNNFAQAAERVEAAGIEPVAPVEPATTNKRGVLPDAFGNNVKGERICRNCGVKESETLAKNPRYSFCKGLCVNCYGKLERKTAKPSELTVPQLEEKIAFYRDLLQKKLAGAQGLSEGNAIENADATTGEAAAVASGATVGSEDDAETLADVSE